MTSKIKTRYSDLRTDLNVDLYVLPRVASALEGYCFQLEAAVKENNNKRIAQVITELQTMCGKYSDKLKDTLERIVRDVADRADLEKTAVEAVSIYEVSQGLPLRLYLFESFGMAFKLVLQDYLGLSTNFPDYAEKFVELFGAVKDADSSRTDALLLYFETEHKAKTVSPETEQEGPARDHYAFTLNVLMALFTLSGLFHSAVIYGQEGRTDKTSLQNNTRLCVRTLLGLIASHIQQPQTKIELIDEIVKMIGGDHEVGRS